MRFGDEVFLIPGWSGPSGRPGRCEPSDRTMKSFMLCEHVILGLDYGYVHFTLFCECAVIENNLIDDFSAKTISCDLYHMTFFMIM